MENLEEIMKRYKLPPEQHKIIINEIFKIMLYNIYPAKKPIAIIDLAPPASGKTGLNSRGYKEFISRQFINNTRQSITEQFNEGILIINGDALRLFHPNANEIGTLYPQHYTKITGQNSDIWTSELFDTALKNRYNIIFEGTGRNTRILDTIRGKMQGYFVIVRGMAVNELNCLISVLERYKLQVQTKGWGRLVSLNDFYKSYAEMPKTIDAIENSGIVNRVEVYKRGDNPSEPILIYNSTAAGNTRRFPNAKYAVLSGRDEDLPKALKYFNERKDFIKKLIEVNDDNPEVNNIINRIMTIALEANKQLKQKDNTKISL